MIVHYFVPHISAARIKKKKNVGFKVPMQQVSYEGRCSGWLRTDVGRPRFLNVRWHHTGAFCVPSQRARAAARIEHGSSGSVAERHKATAAGARIIALHWWYNGNMGAVRWAYGIRVPRCRRFWVCSENWLAALRPPIVRSSYCAAREGPTGVTEPKNITWLIAANALYYSSQPLEGNFQLIVQKGKKKQTAVKYHVICIRRRSARRVLEQSQQRVQCLLICCCLLFLRSAKRSSGWHFSVLWLQRVSLADHQSCRVTCTAYLRGKLIKCRYEETHVYPVTAVRL